jgi:hypothetical protein
MKRLDPCPTIYGAVDVSIGWNTIVVLPIEQATQLASLLAAGLVFRERCPDGEGYTLTNAEGKFPRCPQVEVMTPTEYDQRYARGCEAKKKAAAEAEAEKETAF